MLIVSSDLSHFHNYESARSLDERTNQAVLSRDYLKMESEGQACGKIRILTLLDLAARLEWKCTFLDYKNSGDTIGDKHSVVGYASFAFYQ